MMQKCYLAPKIKFPRNWHVTILVPIGDELISFVAYDSGNKMTSVLLRNHTWVIGTSADNCFSMENTSGMIEAMQKEFKRRKRGR
jgi:hypothetical protein